MGALAVYAIGKTFFWPTMLAVVGDRFPQTGAVAMSLMGGIGMMSAGLIGSPGLGYAKDRFAGEALREANQAVYEEVKAEKPSSFLFFEKVHGIDAKVIGEIQDTLKQPRAELAESESDAPEAALSALTDQQRTILQASIEGDRRTLRVVDAVIPATMAVIYLLLLVYFKSIGGYKPVHIAAELTGGTRGPMEA
jgi:hypothetical protein